MKLKHSDIDYIGQILDNVLYDMLDHPDYHKLSKGIVDDFRYVLTELNGQKCITCKYFSHNANEKRRCNLHGYYDFEIKILGNCNDWEGRL